MVEEACCEVQVGGHRGNSPRFVALVDHADAAVGAYCWSMSEGYAMRKVHVGGKRLKVYLHRSLLDLEPGDGLQVDHINGNKLDNRRENLRVCTIAQNQQNLHERPYRGASWHAESKRWEAYAKLDGKKRHLGLHDTKEEAAVVAAAFRCQHMPFSRDAREAA